MANESNGGLPRFNISDALDVPLRGFLLRLRLVAGELAVKDVRPGSQLRLRAPDGAERVVTVTAKSLTGGRNGQDRLDRSGQLDVIISSDDAYAGGRPVGIGWQAEGPLRGDDGRPARGTIRRPVHAGQRPTRDTPGGGWPFHPPGGRHS